MEQLACLPNSLLASHYFWGVVPICRWAWEFLLKSVALSEFSKALGMDKGQVI